MSDKFELTEKVKATERDLINKKHELKAINSKLETCYKYEDELLQRLEFARSQTKELRNQFFIKSGEITEGFKELKGHLEIYTGNFF